MQKYYSAHVRCESCGASVPKANRHKSYVCGPCKESAKQKAVAIDPLRTCKFCDAQKPTSEWQRDADGRLAKHCGCRRKGKTWTDDDRRQYRREYKRRLRRARGAPTRDDLAKRAANKARDLQRVKDEKAAAKIGPPWPPKFRNQAELLRWRHRNDPSYLLNMRMRVQLRKALRGMKAGRKWEQLVGYTVHDLHEHLRRQLPKGYAMSDFFGRKLHIDHIIPKSMFDVTKPEELAACWALPNLRPLPAAKNMKKGARLESLL